MIEELLIWGKIFLYVFTLATVVGAVLYVPLKLVDLIIPGFVSRLVFRDQIRRATTPRKKYNI